MLRGGRRERREGRREARVGGDESAPEVYQMREKLVSIGDDFWIETNLGRREHAPRFNRPGRWHWPAVYPAARIGCLTSGKRMFDRPTPS